jgi:hypothetical protein
MENEAAFQVCARDSGDKKKWNKAFEAAHGSRLNQI